MFLYLQWENVKKAGIAPRPRTSFGMVHHKNRAYLFGGVADQAGKGDRIYSENFDEMYQFNLDANVRRWFPVTMRNTSKTQVCWLSNTVMPLGFSFNSNINNIVRFTEIFAPCIG